MRAMMANMRAAKVMHLALRDHVRGFNRENRETPASGRSFWSLLYELRGEDEGEAGAGVISLGELVEG